MPAILGNKAKMIKKVLFAIVEPGCFSHFTWSGKSSNGKTKNALKDYPNILKLLHSVMKGPDGTYEYALFLCHLKDKVIKYAYE